jgi:hypothetical protein
MRPSLDHPVLRYRFLVLIGHEAWTGGSGGGPARKPFHPWKPFSHVGRCSILNAWRPCLGMRRRLGGRRCSILNVSIDGRRRNAQHLRRRPLRRHLFRRVTIGGSQPLPTETIEVNECQTVRFGTTPTSQQLPDPHLADDARGVARRERNRTAAGSGGGLRLSSRPGPPGGGPIRAQTSENDLTEPCGVHCPERLATLGAKPLPATSVHSPPERWTSLGD